VLSLHPAFSALLVSYAVAARRGDADAQAVVAKAIAASAEFKVDILVHPDHVWRYPPLIALAVEQLGLSSVYGFPEYAVELGGVLSQSWVDDALLALGLAILLVGVFLTGPLAVTGLGYDIALFGLGAADVRVALWQASLTYLREREQDVAATGSAFSARRIAERSDYSGSVLAGAAALISGIAFVFSAVRLGKGVARAIGQPPMPPPRSTDVTAARRRATQGKGIGSRSTGTDEVAANRGSRRLRNEPAKPPARPRWDERAQPAGPPAKAAVGSGPVGEPLPDVVSEGQPVGQRFIGGRGLEADTPVASGSGRGGGPPRSGGRTGTGVGAAAAGVARAASRDVPGAAAGPRARATAPESKATSAQATERLASTRMTAGSHEYSMIDTPARARAVANPADMTVANAVPFTRLGRPAGELDPVLLAIARDVRARVAGVAESDFFKNVAVARVRIGPNGPVRYIAAVNTSGRLFTDLGRGFDSEMLLLGYAEGRNAERVNYVLEALYTERAPCQTCTSNLAKQFSEIPIFYSVENEALLGGVGRARDLMTRYGLAP
jgi:hypothetical protein